MPKNGLLKESRILQGIAVSLCNGFQAHHCCIWIWENPVKLFFFVISEGILWPISKKVIMAQALLARIN